MPTAVKQSRRDYYTRAANDDCIKGGPRTRTKYCYDANGNNTAGIFEGGYVFLSSTFTSYNQPLLMTSNYDNDGTNYTSLFSYGPDHQRWRQITNDSQNGTITYIGGLLERVDTTAGTSYRYFVPAGSNVVQYQTSSSGAQTYYVTEDHLGSPDTVTDAAGALVLHENFDAWGYPRGDNWTGYPSDSEGALMDTLGNRGINYMEELYDQGSVDFNGRVGAGWFTSPDPYIEDTANPQNYNRYTYVYNNPLTLIDPSGFYQVCTSYQSSPQLEGLTLSGDYDSYLPEITSSASFIQTCFNEPDPIVPSLNAPNISGSTSGGGAPSSSTPKSLPKTPNKPPPQTKPSFHNMVCNAAAKLGNSEPQSDAAALELGATTASQSGEILPGIDPSLTSAGKTLSDVAGPIATGVSAFNVASNIHNGNYANAAFGAFDTAVDITLIGKFGVPGAALAGIYTLAGGSKAAASGALGAACAVSGLFGGSN